MFHCVSLGHFLSGFLGLAELRSFYFASWETDPFVTVVPNGNIFITCGIDTSHMQPSKSVSRFNIIVEIVGKGSTKAELVRHLAPLTSNAILKALPLRDRIHKYADRFAYIETGLVLGAEKQKTKFRRGELTFLPSNGSICLFLQDAFVQPMNPLGAIIENVDLFESIRPGDIMLVRNS